jgi:DNA repair exonuclease SbcCD ATPase subunit
MNVELISNILTKRYKAIRQSPSDVFWVTFTYKNRSMATCVFDCTDSVAKEGFDVREYQHDILSHEYYVGDGSLQWNYYLYLLCQKDEYSDLCRSGRVAQIEKNCEYARKFVLPEDRLEEELAQTENLTSETGTTVPQDISVRWIEYLRNAQLDGVFLEKAPRVQVVARYIAGDPLLEPPEQPQPDNSDAAETFNSLRRIIISRFRPYPRQREFTFGSANLIEGANGVGKTSLLEAIETWMCGKTYRNCQNDSASTRIGLVFADNNLLRWNGSESNEIFRARDLVWYGNHYAKGNQLWKGFNRFNFYDSDAGYRLANDPQAANVNEPLTALVLGRSANVISERVAAIRAMFTTEQGSINREMQLHTKALDEAAAELSGLPTVVEQTQEVQAQLLIDLRAAGWQEEIHVDGDDATLLREFDEAFARVEDCRSHLWWLPSLSLSAVQAAQQVVKPLVQDIRQLESKSRNHHREIVDLQALMESTQARLERLARLEHYVSDPDSRTLLGLNERVAAVENRIRCLELAQGQLQDVAVEGYREISDTAGAYYQQLQSLVNTATQEIAGLERKLAEIEEQHGRISRLCDEMRTLAGDLLAVDPDRSQCPVCGAEYAVGELLRRLEQQLRATVTTQSVGELVSELRERRLALEDTKRRIRETAAILSASDTLRAGGEQIPERLDECAVVLGGLPAMLRDLTEAFDVEHSLQTRLEVKGNSETELRELLEWLWALTPNRKESFPQPQELDDLQSQHQSKLAQVSKDLYGAQNALTACESQIAVKLQSYFGPPLPQEPFNELLIRDSQIDDVVAQLGQVGVVCSIRGDELLSDVSARVAAAKAAYERYQRNVKSVRESQERRTTIQQRLDQANAAIAVAKAKKQRVDHAVEVLGTIASEESNENNLEAALGDSVGEIARIFRMIHSPREFASIEFSSGKGEAVSLVREGSREKCSISQISTGQRSALALSIFLALNRRLSHGPPLLLFDDPLANVDDLNVLSFLDYLRAVVIRGERQVFFATANKKLASLFQKKFAFLGDEFVRIQLERE